MMTSPLPTFIRVKYGDDETLICNPSCAVINLLASIKNRTGHVANTITVDLTDDSGLIQELDSHRQGCAADYLTTPGTYVLVKKQRLRRQQNNVTGDGTSSIAEYETIGEGLEDDEQDNGVTPQFDYVPLLNNWHQLLPGYRLRRPLGAGAGADGFERSPAGTTAAARRRLQRRDRNKSPSPAGVRPTAGSRTSSTVPTIKTTSKDRSALGPSSTSRKQDKINSASAI